MAGRDEISTQSLEVTLSESSTKSPEPLATHTRRVKRRKGRTNEEKCADILAQLTYQDRIPLSTLLQYIISHRKEKAVAKQFSQLKEFIAEFASICVGPESDTDTPAITLSEWSNMFNQGLWDVAQSLLRQEILQVSKLEELCMDIEATEKEKPKQSDPVIPVDAIYERAPRTVQLLHEICQPRERLQRRMQIPLTRISYIITNLCTLQQRRSCEAVPVSIGCFLQSNGLSRKGIEILSRFGVCCSYNRIRAINNVQMERTHSEVRALSGNLRLNITIDNFDMADGVNDERIGDHSTHTSATTGLVHHGIEIPDTGLMQNMLDRSYRIKMHEVISAGIGHTSLPKLWHFYIFSAVRVAFQGKVRELSGNNVTCFDIALRDIYQRPAEQLIPLRTEPLKKDPTSEAIPIEPILIDESTTEGMLQILENIMVKQLGFDEDDQLFNEQLFLIHGDQKTVDRLRSCRHLRAEDTRPFDTMKWFLPCLGLWHAKFNYLSLVHENHWGMASPDEATLHAHAAFWGRKNLQTPKSFRALEELEIHSFQARIVAMFIRNMLKDNFRVRTQHGAVKAVSDQLRRISQAQLESRIEEVYSQIHDTRHQPIEGQTPDQELWNHILFIRNTFPYLLLKDGIKYGDIGYLRIAIAILCVYYQGTSNTRYAKEFLHLFTLTFQNGAATPELQYAVLTNSIVNHRGSRDTHFEKDRELEFLNRFIKDCRVRHHASSTPAGDHMRKAALLSPQSMLLSTRFAEQVHYKDRDLHPEKPSTEDVLSLASRLWRTGSVNPQKHRDTQCPTDDFLQTGLRHLEPNIQRFNRALNAVGINTVIGSAIQTLMEDEDDQMESADEVDLQLSLQPCRPRLLSDATDSGSSIDITFLVDSHLSQIQPEQDP